MNSKITCMCITHNRVHLLERSMKCFTDQTYANKELIILHTYDDIETAKFSEANHGKYRRIKLTNLQNTEGLAIESIKDRERAFEEIESGQKVSLKTKSGKYLSVLPDGTLTEKLKVGRQESFVVTKEGTKVALKSPHKSWLSIDKAGKYHLSQNLRSSEIFKAIIQVNTKAILIPYVETSGEATLEEEGWKIEHLNNVNSDITLIEVHSDPPISLGSKRNIVLKLAQGDHVCVWDDDDWYDNNRLAYQLGFAEYMQKPASALISTFMYDHYTHKGYIAHPREDGWEPSLLCRKTEFGLYSNLNKREDTPVLKRLFTENKLAVMDDHLLYIYNVHTGKKNTNTCSSEHFLNIINSPRTESATEEDMIYVRNILKIEASDIV